MFNRTDLSERIKSRLISNSRDTTIDLQLLKHHKQDANESKLLISNETTKFSTITSLSSVNITFYENNHTSPHDLALKIMNGEYDLTNILDNQNYIFQDQIKFKCSSECKTTSYIDNIKIDHILIENIVDFKSIYPNIALNHRYIPKCLGILEENDKTFALIEHYNSCLEDFLVDYKYKEKNVRKFLGVVKAVMLLHYKGISHGNINLKAILVNHKGKYALGKLDWVQKFYEQSVMNKDYHFCAPEQLLEKQVLPSTDIWALACVLYVIVTGKIPYDDVQDLENCIEQVVFEGKKPKEINNSVYMKFKDVFNASFKIEPRKRPSIDMFYSLIQASITTEFL